MHYLSENNIKTVTLRFLKTYYKFRPRSGETRLQQDLKSADGVIADGQLVFPTEEGAEFTATFEATSHQTREEVIYQLQKKMLASDAAAVGFLICAFVFSWGYAYGHITIEELGALRYFGLLFLLFLICFWGYRSLFYRWHRYRYIYAIEQFKHYHADEQWIAIGEDVFKSPADPSFIELRDQCIYNGFGLIIISLDLEPQLSITPSRQELFGRQRDDKIFQKKKRQSDSKSLSTRLSKRFKNPLGNAYSLLRYRRSNYMQLFLSAVCLSILALISYFQLRDDSIIFADEQMHEQAMKKKKAESLAETKVFRMDTVSMKDYRELDEPYISEEIPEEDADLPAETGEVKDGEILVGVGDDNELTRYDCERFYNIHQKVYIVQDNAYPDIEGVQKRIQRLSKAGLEVNALWLGCFSSTNKDYVVYFDMMYESKAEADQYAKQFRKQLNKKGIKSSKLAIRSIQRAR